MCRRIVGGGLSGRRRERDAAAGSVACDRSAGTSGPSPSSQLTVICVQRRAAEDAGHRGIGGVAAGADAHEPVQVRQARRVEHHPAAADEALEAGVEVRRLELDRRSRRNSAPGCSARGTARCRGARSRGRRRSAASPCRTPTSSSWWSRAGIRRCRGSSRAIATTFSCGFSIVAEQVPGQPAEPIRLAVAAGKQIRDRRRAQLRDRRRLDRAGAIGLEVAVHRRRVAES